MFVLNFMAIHPMLTDISVWNEAVDHRAAVCRDALRLKIINSNVDATKPPSHILCVLL